MEQDFAVRFREAFAKDLAKTPILTLRQADTIDACGSASSQDQTVDAVTDTYLEQYSSGLLHLDSASWRHYLPAFADFAQRSIDTPSIVVGSLIASLRSPERGLSRLEALTLEQETLLRAFLEMLASAPASVWQAEACQALAEWWIEKPRHLPRTGHDPA